MEANGGAPGVVSENGLYLNVGWRRRNPRRGDKSGQEPDAAIWQHHLRQSPLNAFIGAAKTIGAMLAHK
jgi:hypothetical protein